MVTDEGSPFCFYSGFGVLVFSADDRPSCSYASLIFLIPSISERVVKGSVSFTAMGRTCRPVLFCFFVQNGLPEALAKCM